MKKYLVLLLIFPSILFSSTTYAAEGEIAFAKTSLSELLQTAEKSNKLIFVDAYTTWCGPCKWMAANVFKNSEAIEFYDKNFLSIKLDMEKGEGLNFAKKYGIEAYPTYVFFNSLGEMVHQACGKMEVQEFIKMGNDALNPSTQLSSLKQNFDNGDRSFEFLKNYTRALYNANKLNDDVIQLLLALPEASQLVTEADFEMLSSYPKIEQAPFNFILENREKFEALVGKDKVKDFVVSSFLNEAKSAAKENSSEKLKLATLSLDKYTIENKNEIIANMSWQYARVTKIELFNAAKNYVENFKMTDADELNDVSWEVFLNCKNPQQLQAAEKWAKTSVDLNPNFMNTDTYANILHKLGKNKEALKYANLSIQMAIKKDADTSETEKLRKEIELQLSKSKVK